MVTRSEGRPFFYNRQLSAFLDHQMSSMRPVSWVVSKSASGARGGGLLPLRFCGCGAFLGAGGHSTGEGGGATGVLGDSYWVIARGVSRLVGIGGRRTNFCFVGLRVMVLGDLEVAARRRAGSQSGPKTSGQPRPWRQVGQPDMSDEKKTTHIRRVALAILSNSSLTASRTVFFVFCFVFLEGRAYWIQFAWANCAHFCCFS